MATKRLAHDCLATGIDSVNLEDIFRQIQANTSDLHDGSPSVRLTADRNLRREGGVHTIDAGIVPLAGQNRRGLARCEGQSRMCPG